jgi:PAS domain S-box-containing protein
MPESVLVPSEQQKIAQPSTAEETFRRAFEYTGVGMVLVGTDGCLFQVNQAACEMFGYPAEELVTKTFQELTHPDDLEVGVELFQDILAGRRDHGWLEKRYVRKDGKVIWTIVSTATVRDAQGELLYLVSHIQDVTERKEAESSLAEKEAQYRGIFEATTDGLIINDLDGTIVEVNPAFCEMHGYARQELMGLHPTVFIHPDDHSLFEEYLQTVRAGEAFRGRAVDLRKDGTPFHVEVHGTPFVHGGQRHVLGVVRDVTEQVQAQQILEEKVAARTQELAALYDVTAVASASLDLETVMEQSLDRVLEVMGSQIGGIHLLDEANGEVNLATWRNIPAEIVTEIQSMPVGSGIVGRIIEQGAPLVVPAMADDPNAAPAARRILDQPVYVGAPMRAKGQVIGVLGVVGTGGRQFNAEEVALLASIADQIGVAVENARLYQQAERLAVVEERQRLARELHDSVTQSLYSCTLLTETARRSSVASDQEEVQGYLEELGKVAQQALKEMRLLVHELRPLALEQEGLVGALQQRIDAVEGRAGIQARLLVEGEVRLEPSVEEALYRIGQEALNNALKHALAGSVTLRIQADEDLVEMEIVDDGQGFDPGAVREGGGMGLTTMRERAERVGGSLVVRSLTGEGTTVTISVPTQEPGNHEHIGKGSR